MQNMQKAPGKNSESVLHVLQGIFLEVMLLCIGYSTK